MTHIDETKWSKKLWHKMVKKVMPKIYDKKRENDALINDSKWLKKQMTQTDWTYWWHKEMTKVFNTKRWTKVMNMWWHKLF